MNSYKELLVWQKGMDFAVRIYTVTARFPDSERFNLISQMRRSVTSISSNIAEGHGRKSNGEFGQFLRIAYGSSSELETQIQLAERLHFLAAKDSEELLAELETIRKMLNKLLSTIVKSRLAKS